MRHHTKLPGVVAVTAVLFMPIADRNFDSPPSDIEQFCTTHWSVVLLAGDPASPPATYALERPCRTYWYPLFAYVRRSGYGAHDAQDLTQGFFALLLGQNFLECVDRRKGSFR